MDFEPKTHFFVPKTHFWCPALTGKRVLKILISGNNAAASEIANLEQIEVLEGPASVLYSETDPGGLINLATTKPLSEPVLFPVENNKLLPVYDRSRPVLPIGLPDTGEMIANLGLLLFSVTWGPSSPAHISPLEHGTHLKETVLD